MAKSTPTTTGSPTGNLKIELTPPFYLLKSLSHCYSCGKTSEVFCLAANGFKEADFSVLEFCHFSNLSDASDLLLGLLRQHARCYYLDYSRQRSDCYYINHCHCGTKLSDYSLHNAPNGAFFPVSKQQASAISMIELAVAAPLFINACYVIHDDDLISLNAKRETLQSS